MYDVDEGAAYAVLISVLSFFFLLAILSAGYFSEVLPLPEWMRNFIVARGEDGKDADITVAAEGDSKTSLLATDFFLSARASTGSFGIAMSYFASGMGAWVVYATAEMGATPAISWLGVLGYASASAGPALLIVWLGPLVREQSGEEAFTTADFSRKRYGRVMQVTCMAVSFFYMYIYLVAELTSISNVYGWLTNQSNFMQGTDSESYTTGIAVLVGLFTIAYTCIAGLPASIVTDKFQGIMVAALVLLLTIAVCASPENQVSHDEFKEASDFTEDGAYAAITLIIAILCAEMFNQATWQRVWASKDTKSMRNGFFLGSFLVFLLMTFFGIMGLISYAKDPESYENFSKLAFLSFFDLLEPLPEGWHILTLVLVTALAASSIDSLQNGMTSVFSSDLLAICKLYGFSPSLVKIISCIVMVVTNGAAIKQSADRYDVLDLFLVADLVCATSVFPVFLGLLDEKKWGILSPTEWGAFMGCLTGIVCVLVIGLVKDYDTYKDEPFEYFWLNNGAICALCGTDTMWTFIITPLVSLAGTVLFTGLDIAIRGDNARQPIFEFGFPLENEEPAELPLDTNEQKVLKVDEVGA